jgi:hypothetical protein
MLIQQLVKLKFQVPDPEWGRGYNIPVALYVHFQVEGNSFCILGNGCYIIIEAHIVFYRMKIKLEEMVIMDNSRGKVFHRKAKLKTL